MTGGDWAQDRTLLDAIRAISRSGLRRLPTAATAQH